MRRQVISQTAHSFALFRTEVAGVGHVWYVLRLNVVVQMQLSVEHMFTFSASPE